MNKINKHSTFLGCAIISFVLAAVFLAFAIYSAVLGFGSAIKKTLPKEENIKEGEAVVKSIEIKKNSTIIYLNDYDFYLEVENDVSKISNDIQTITNEKIYFGYVAYYDFEFISIEDFSRYNVKKIVPFYLQTSTRNIFTFDDIVVAKQTIEKQQFYYCTACAGMFLIVGIALCVLSVKSKKDDVNVQ